MNKRTFLLSAALIAVWMLGACAPAVPTADPAMQSTISALNAQLTQSAAELDALVAALSATPEATNTPAVTNTPRPTQTPQATNTPLNGLLLTFDATTNCRIGPGTNYPIETSVEAGTQLQALGRSEDGEFFYVRAFDTTNHYCWVWKGTSYQTGSVNWVPVMTTQPTKMPSITPTSGAGFTAVYKSLQSCSGKYYLNFDIRNTGYLTWQSIKITIVDAATSTTVVHSVGNFTGYEGCNVAHQEGDLVTGESGPVSSYNPGELAYDPTGHVLNVTVSLYSEKGNAGTVVTRTLSVTP